MKVHQKMTHPSDRPLAGVQPTGNKSQLEMRNDRKKMGDVENKGGSGANASIPHIDLYKFPAGQKAGKRSDRQYQDQENA